MPKINLDTTLKNAQGLSFKNGEADLDVAGALLFALEHKIDGQDIKESMECYKLRKEIFKGGEVELTSEDITLLKTKAHACLTQPVFFSVVDILEA